MKMVSNCIICLCKSSSVIFPRTRSRQTSSTNLQNLAFIGTLDCNMPIFFFDAFYTQHVTGNYKNTVTVTHCKGRESGRSRGSELQAVQAAMNRNNENISPLHRVDEPERSEGRVVSLRKNQPFLGCLQKSSHMHRLGLGWQPKNLQKILPPITRHRRQHEQPSLRSSIG